jgi:hypothetical protein
MFKFRKQVRRAILSAVDRQANDHSNERAAKFGMESLENRQLLSGQAPSAVQTGLDTDATDHGLTAPTSSTKAKLANVNGAEAYSVTITSAGAVTKLTVDAMGDEVTPPSSSKTTFGELSGTGTGSDTAASNAISSIATALGLTAPTSTTGVRALTENGVTTYSVRLAHSSSTSTHPRMVTLTVDSAGNAVGNEDVPFSVLSSTIQAGINTLVPTGSTALAADSTQTVNVRTIDGVVLYSTTFTSTGASTKVTVNSTGAAASAPTQTTTTFGALSSAVQTAIQTLATANGVSGTIASDQTINVYTEANGTLLYSVTLSATSKKDTSVTFDLTITVDSDGNPTVLPRQSLFGPPEGFGGGGHHNKKHGGGGGGDDGGDSGSGSGTGTNTGNTSSSSGSLLSGAEALRRR